MKRFILVMFSFLFLIPFTAQAFGLVVEQGAFSVVHEAPAAADPFNYEIIGPRYATATAKYSMKVAVTMPTGTSGAATVTSGTKPTNTKYVPCDNATVTDGVTITLTYNATGTAGTVDADVYVLFYDPHTTNFYMIKRTTFTAPIGITVTTNLGVAAATAAKSTDIYLAAANNPGGTITETLLGNTIYIMGAPAGTWQVVGIVAPSATVDFNDPATWKAWDVGTFVIRKPWLGLAPTNLCQ